MTSAWIPEHGWCYLHGAIAGYTRETTTWPMDVGCRATEAVAVSGSFEVGFLNGYR